MKLLKIILVLAEILNELIAKRASEFVDIKDKIGPNNLIYNFKIKGKKNKRF